MDSQEDEVREKARGLSRQAREAQIRAGGGRGGGRY
jgi:hypothetical protein